MGKVLSLWKSVEKSLHTRSGSWAKAVSKAVDSLLMPMFAEVKLIDAVQAVADLATGETVLFDTVLSQNGVTYNASTGRFTLLANSTYELEAHLQFENFGTADDVARWRWLDDEGSTLPPGHRVEGKAVPPGSTLGVSGISCAKVVMRTTRDMDVLVFVTGGTGSADISLGSYAIVRKVG